MIDDHVSESQDVADDDYTTQARGRKSYTVGFSNVRNVARTSRVSRGCLQALPHYNGTLVKFAV